MDRRPTGPLIIDCAACPVQHIGCADCMVSVLLAPPERESTDHQGPALAVGTELPLDRREREVITRLIASGLVSVETANQASAVIEPRERYDELGRCAG